MERCPTHVVALVLILHFIVVMETATRGWKLFRSLKRCNRTRDPGADGLGRSCLKSTSTCRTRRVTHTTQPDPIAPVSGDGAWWGMGRVAARRLHGGRKRSDGVYLLRLPPRLTVAGHDENHVHGEGCGHPKVAHDDHYDYVVSNFLHHVHDGHCDHHGEVTWRYGGWLGFVVRGWCRDVKCGHLVRLMYDSGVCRLIRCCSHTHDHRWWGRTHSPVLVSSRPFG